MSGHVLTTQSVRVLGFMAGVKSITKQALERAVRVADEVGNELLRKGVIMMEHGKRKTLEPRDILQESPIKMAAVTDVKKIARHGKKGAEESKAGRASVTGGVRKPHRYRAGTVALRKIRFYQRQEGVVGGMSYFSAYIKNYFARNGLDKIQVKKSARYTFQTIIEQIVVRILGDAQLSSVHRRHTRVQNVDIDLVINLWKNNLLGNSFYQILSL